MNIVECRDVTKIYDQGRVKVTALNGVSLKIEKGAFLAIAGPSGSGKTTLLNIFGGLDVPDQGTVSVDGRLLNQMSQSALAELRLHRVGFVFQSYNLIPVLSAMENVEFGMLLQGVSAAERRKRARSMLDDVGLDICFSKGRYWVLEANMKFGREGFRRAGIDYYELMDEMIENGEI